MPLFGPVEETYVVAGSREEWLSRCRRAVEGSRYFRTVVASDPLFELNAKFHKVPLWGHLWICLLPEGKDTTRIIAKATALPNLFAIVTGGERQILAEFSRAIAVECAPREEAA